MKGQTAICPTSGATLSEQKHYPEGADRPLRVPENDHVYGDDCFELTTGARCSSKRALMNFVRRTHERHHDPDKTLYQTVALELRRLKRESTARDEWVLYALAERLHRRHFDIEWLRAHIEPVCPRCGGPLAFKETPRGVDGKCATNCSDDNDFRNWEIRERVLEAYNATFDDDPLRHDEVTVL